MNVREFLVSSGVYPNIIGFNQTIEAVEILRKNPNAKLKEIYGEIGSKSNKCVSSVSRTIGYAIEKADKKKIKEIFGKELVKNGEFISYFANKKR